jgi:hypothetical protein
MAINNFARLAQIYRAGTNAGPELQAMTQVWMDPDGDHHTKTKIDGASLGTATNENANNNKQAYNRSMVVGEYIYWLQGNSIYAYHTHTGSQVTSKTLPSGANGNLRGMNSGLYQALISGVPHIVTVHMPNDTSVRAAVQNIATSGWSDMRLYTAATFRALEASGGFRAEIFYNNKLYIAGNRTYLIYNPATDTYVEGTFPTTSLGPFDWCPYMGGLYLTGHRSNSGGVQIFEMVENNGPVFRAESPGLAIAAQEHIEGRATLFTDREHLYSIYYSSGTPQPGFGMYKFGMVGDSVSYIGDVTSTINPGTAAAKNGSDVNNTSRFRVTTFVHQNEDPDGQEGIVFYFDRGGGTGNHISLGVPQYYEQQVWDTNATNLQFDESNTGTVSGVFTTVGRVDTSEDGGPASPLTAYQLAYSTSKNGAGERIYNLSIAPEPRIQITRVATSGQIVGINYRIATNTINFANGTDVAVLFKYDENKHSPRKNCYLQNTNIGTIVGNRKIVVAADNQTDYYVEWNAQQDGFGSRVRAAIVPFIATTGTT